MADGIDDPPLDQLGNAQQDPPPQQNPAPAQDPPQVNQLPQHDLPPGAAEHAHIVGVQRGGIVQRLQRWINFVNQPEFAEMDYYAAKTRQDRGADLMKQMEEAQLDYVAALATARQPVVPVGDEFMQLEEQYFNANVDSLNWLPMNRDLQVLQMQHQTNCALLNCKCQPKKITSKILGDILTVI